VNDYSDWLVTNRYENGPYTMETTYVLGSPYVYFLFNGGNPRLLFGHAPTVWYGASNSPVLGITVNGRHYGLFGPSGSSWSGLGSNTLINNLGGRNYFSIAVLPDSAVATLEKFRQYAYSHVTKTR